MALGAATLLSQALVFIAPLQIQVLLDRVIYKHDERLALLLCTLCGIAGVSHCVLEAARAKVLLSAGLTAEYNIKSNVIRGFLSAETAVAGQGDAGDVLNRLGSASTIQQFITGEALSAILDGLVAAASAVLLYFYSPLLATLTYASLAANFGIAYVTFPSLRRTASKAIEASAAEESWTAEAAASLVTIKVGGVGVAHHDRWAERARTANAAALAQGICEIRSTTLRSLVVAVPDAIVMCLGTLMVMRNPASLTVGMFVAFLSYRIMFVNKTAAFVSELIRARYLGLHLSRLNGVGEVQEVAAVTCRRLELAGDLVVEGLSVRRADDHKWALRDVSFKVRSGEFVAVTGPSGGGKSTILDILMGLHPICSGEVLINGVPATPAHWAGWRHSIAYIRQSDCLFSGTLAENIAGFDADIDHDRVRLAGREALLEDEVRMLPEGYDTRLGHMGAGLSGGQRQRVLLARALYKRPHLLVIDEGTAGLHEELDDELALRIAQLPITRIVVAHRSSINRYADRVLRVADGSVACTSDAAASHRSTCYAKDEPVQCSRSR